MVSFLQSTPEAKKEKLFSYGRAHAPEMRKKKRDEEAMVKLQVQEKMAANQDEHIQKGMKAVCSNAELVAKLKITGGPCANAQDIDLLCERLASTHSKS